MELIWATDDFKLHGVSYRDFPILLDSEMVGVSPANTFLRYHLLQRGRVGSAKSWKVYGQALYDYFGSATGNPLVVMPTGTGKSVVIGGFIREAIAAYADTRVLVLTHVKELIQQNFMALLRATPGKFE